MIEVTYLARLPDRAPEALAEAIAREQSLEILPELIPEEIRQTLLGRVIDVTAVDEQRWALKIAYPDALASRQLGQLIQLIYGNVSFYPRIRLQDLRLGAAILADFRGPIGGLPLIRKRTGVEHRALLLTVLKPRGSSPAHLANLAEQFALGGGDILKDDQNLVESSLSAFEERVSACADAIERARDRTGRECLYLPNIAGSGDHLGRQLEWVAERGLAGVVLCPWIMGLESASAAASRFDLMWLAHPAGAGVYTQSDDLGISARVLFGQLTRLAGADLTLFPGQGGRLSLRCDNQDIAIADALRGQCGTLAGSLPCTGGGKTLEQAPEVARALGEDCAVVVGGDLLRHGKQLRAVTAQTVERLSVRG